MCILAAEKIYEQFSNILPRNHHGHYDVCPYELDIVPRCKFDGNKLVLWQHPENIETEKPSILIRKILKTREYKVFRVPLRWHTTSAKYSIDKSQWKETETDEGLCLMEWQYKTDSVNFPYARVLRRVYTDQIIPCLE